MKISILILIYLISNVCKAQQTLELSLNEAIKLAQENNLLIRQSMLSQIEAKFNQFSTLAQGLPKVDLQYGYQNFFDQRVYLGPMVFTFNPTSNAQITIGQLLFNGNYIISLQIQSLLRKLSDLSLQKVRGEVYKQIVNSYFLILVTQHTETILKQNLENLDKLLTKTQTYVKVGIIDETAIDQISIQKMTIENALNSTYQQKELALNIFRIILNIDQQTNIVLKDNLFWLLDNLNYEHLLVKKDLTNNIDFQIQGIQTQLAKKQMQMKKMNFLPTITGFYTYTEKIKRPELDFSPNNIIGIQASIPIFSSGNRFYALRSAQIQFDKALLQSELYINQLKIQEQQLLINLKTSIERYNIQKEIVELSKKNYQKMILKFEQGVISAIDLINSHTNLLQAESNLVASILQLIEAKTNYEAFYANHKLN